MPDQPDPDAVVRLRARAEKAEDALGRVLHVIHGRRDVPTAEVVAAIRDTDRNPAA